MRDSNFMDPNLFADSFCLAPNFNRIVPTQMIQIGVLI